MSLLEIKNLKVSFGDKKAVDDVSISLQPGEIVGLVGESGCGKSLTALSILGLTPINSSLSGEIIFKSKNLLVLTEDEKRIIRGNEISLIPQDPLSALNPVFSIGDQILETVKAHKDVSNAEAMKSSINALSSVQIPASESRFNNYPHEFSGGMRQRVLIAMAIVNEPDLLIADEPTTALDVTVQLQILNIMKDLRSKGKSILLITHDLGIVSEICDRVYVMYLGKIIESAQTQDLLKNPKHPYTKGLLNSLPSIHKQTLTPIKGQPPNISSIPSGCSFHPRCEFVFDKCNSESPELYACGSNHFFRCFLEDK